MFWEANILLKFLVGKCTRIEVKEIKIWLAESHQNKNTLLHLKAVIENIGKC